MKVSDIIDRVSRILYDTTKVRWQEPELIDYINDAQMQVVLHRPDANSKNAAISLTTGNSKQTLPAGGIRFLRAVRNMGATGSTPGKALTEVPRDLLDKEDIDWHTKTGTEVLHYVFDDVDPKNFYVYPSVSSSWQIEIVYSATPTTVTASTDTLDLPDEYINPIMDWVLFRCYSKNSKATGNQQRAMAHLQNFANELGVTMRINWQVSGDPEVQQNSGG